MKAIIRQTCRAPAVGQALSCLWGYKSAKAEEAAGGGRAWQGTRTWLGVFCFHRYISPVGEQNQPAYQIHEFIDTNA